MQASTVLSIGFNSSIIIYPPCYPSIPIFFTSLCPSIFKSEFLFVEAGPSGTAGAGGVNWDDVEELLDDFGGVESNRQPPEEPEYDVDPSLPDYIKMHNKMVKPTDRQAIPKSNKMKYVVRVGAHRAFLNRSLWKQLIVCTSVSRYCFRF